MTINSGFSHQTWVDFPVRYVSHYQRVIPWNPNEKTPTKTRRQPHTTRPTVKALLLAVPFGESVALLAFLGAPAPWNFADRSFRSGSTLNSWRSIDDLLLTIGEYLLMILNDIEWYWWILMIYWWFIADNRWTFFQYQPLLGFAQIVTLDSRTSSYHSQVLESAVVHHSPSAPGY